MNKHILSGRPTQDPEIKYSGAGEEAKKIARFTMASNHMHDEGADFITCVAFGKKADFIEKYIHKGMLLLVTGPERNNNYTKTDGTQVYGFNLIVESIEIMEKKRTEENGAEETGEFMNAPDDAEVPFNQ